MRSVEEIDAEIAKLKEIKNQQEYGVPTRLTPEYRAGRFDYIVGGDRSGLDAYQQAVNSAVNNKLQRDFQDRQRLANEAFQSIENDKNRAVQAKSAADNRVTEKAKMLSQLRDSYDIVKDAVKNPSKYTSLEVAKAKNAFNMNRSLVADSGWWTEEELANMPSLDDLDAPETPEGGEGDGKTDKMEAAELDRLINEAKTVEEIDKLIAQANGRKEDEGNTESYQKLIEKANKKKEDIKKADSARKQKQARIDEGKKHAFSKSDVRTLLDIKPEGGGKNEAEVKFSYTFNGKTLEANGKWIRDGKKAKLVVDGETVQVIDLF